MINKFEFKFRQLLGVFNLSDLHFSQLYNGNKKTSQRIQYGNTGKATRRRRNKNGVRD